MANKKNIINLLNYATQQEARYLVISSQNKGLVFDYHLANHKIKHLLLSKKLEKGFLDNLKQVLNIKDKKLISKRYQKITYYHQSWAIYLSVLPDRNQEKIIIDFIKKPSSNFRLSQLGLKNKDSKNLQKGLQKKSGLFIITSPPQQGKSTTLQALLSLLNDPHHNLYFLGFLENQELPGVNYLDSNETNWSRLQHHDSEIILADNINQDWELREAFSSAVSGRLVVITLNTPDYKSVIKKIKSLKLPSSLIKTSLKMIIEQKLIPLKLQKNNSPHFSRQLIAYFKLRQL